MRTDNGKITRIYWFYAVDAWGHIVEKNSSGVCEYGLFERFGKIWALRWQPRWRKETMKTGIHIQNISKKLYDNTTIRRSVYSAHTFSLVRCGRPHRSFCQFRRTTWTLLLVVSLLLLQDSETLFLWTVELLHLLTHLRPGLRHFSLLRHNPHCTMARY